jgi:hypothetical protein
MAQAIYFRTTDADGRDISGTYSVSGKTITVTLFDGSSKSTQLGNLPVEVIAKMLLRELDRKRRGES